MNVSFPRLTSSGVNICYLMSRTLFKTFLSFVKGLFMLYTMSEMTKRLKFGCRKACDEIEKKIGPDVCCHPLCRGIFFAALYVGTLSDAPLLAHFRTGAKILCW